MKHKTPDMNPEKSKNIHVEYRAKTAKNIDPPKNNTHYTQKKSKTTHKPSQTQTGTSCTDNTQKRGTV